MPTGRLVKRGNRWTAVINSYEGPKGTVPQKWVATGCDLKRDAHEVLQRLLNELKEGQAIVQGKDPLKDHLERWIELKRHDYSIRTYEGHRSIIRLHLNPVLGDIRLVKLRPQHLENYFDLKRESLSETTLAQHYMVLSGALKSAVRKELIVKNPLPLIDNKPSPQTTEMKTWRPEEVSRFLEVAAKHSTQAHTLFRLFWESGCRKGEALGLKWEDVEFGQERERCWITIRRSLRKSGPNPNIGPPKRNQRRRISVSFELKKLLAQHRRELNELKMSLGGRFEDQGFVFCKMHGQVRCLGHCLDLFSFTERWFHPIRKAAKLEHIRVHDFRHSAITHQLSQNVPVKQVASRAGHARVETTLNVYAHAISEADELIADQMGDALLR